MSLSSNIADRLNMGSTTITILGIIHRPIFYSKHSVSETGFCLRLQVEPTRLCPVDRASLSPDQTVMESVFCYRRVLMCLGDMCRRGSHALVANSSLDYTNQVSCRHMPFIPWHRPLPGDFGAVLRCFLRCSSSLLPWSGLLAMRQEGSKTIEHRVKEEFSYTTRICSKQAAAELVGTLFYKSTRVRFPMRSFNFSVDLILSGPGVDSAPNRNEYQQSFWR
jgi:hypothetical protein